MIETGILFGNVHSFRDLDMILSKVEISPAAPKVTYVDIPGGDGSLDLTEAHGEVKYSDRVIRVTLSMNPASGLSETAWEAKKTEVSNSLNGLACDITLDKDPDYYWTGRCSVDSYLANKKLRQIVVVARVRPYKLKQAETVVTFPAGNGTTVEYKDIQLDSRKTVVPTIHCAENARVYLEDNTVFEFAPGTHKQLGIVLTTGQHMLRVVSTGVVTFTFREGDL